MRTIERAGERAARAPRVTTEGGMALLAVLVVLAVVAAATAGTLCLTHAELWSAGRARSRAQARYTAEAGVVHAIAIVAPGTSFAPIVAARGGLVDSAAPGPLPFPGGGWVEFPGPPYGYAVTSHALSDAGGASPTERVRLVARGTAVRGAERTVHAVVGRDVEPYVPAALVVTTGAVVLDGGAVAGPGDPPRVTIDGRSLAVAAAAAIAAADDAGGEAALRALQQAGAEVLGETAVARPIDVAAYAESTGFEALSPADVGSPLGSAEAPAARLVGPGVLAGLAGHGAIVATGDLELRGDVAWSGAIVVGGALWIDAASCELRGAVWAQSLRLRSPCSIRVDRGSVLAADRALRLPRLPVLLALVDG